MQKSNCFEIIEASPAWDEKKIAMHIKTYGKIDQHIKQEALKKYLNPQERMLQELKTFHDPDYSALSNRTFNNDTILGKLDND